MIQTTLKIEGMHCGMCEAHINDAIRRAFPVKRVKASHKKNEAVILSEQPLDADELSKTIQDTGYQLVSQSSAPYIKKGLFH
jgi:copper chaperone CopZ